jgi:hypothetical protein
MGSRHLTRALIRAFGQPPRRSVSLDANHCGASGRQPITASMTKNPTT